MSIDRPDYRGYAGTVSWGVFKPGDNVTVLPSGRTTTVAGIDQFESELDAAFAPLSVTIRLADDIDISRGDMIAAAPQHHQDDRHGKRHAAKPGPYPRLDPAVPLILLANHLARESEHAKYAPAERVAQPERAGERD